MRLIRALAALALLKAGYWMIDRADDLRLAGPQRTHRTWIADKPTSHPAGYILLASLTGLAICFVWIWINARAWQ